MTHGRRGREVVNKSLTLVTGVCHQEAESSDTVLSPDNMPKEWYPLLEWFLNPDEGNPSLARTEADSV